MTFSVRAAVLLGLLALASAAPVKHITIFGDSLSDVNNLRQTLALPVTGYGVGGRFTNGPVAVEVLARLLKAKLRNVAYGGATASSVNSPPLIPHLHTQIDIFNFSNPASLLPADRLSIIWIGGNDMFLQLDQLAANATTPLQVQTFIATAVPTAIGTAIQRLIARQEKNIMVMTLPPLEQAPLIANNPLKGLVSALLVGMNQAINASVVAVKAANPTANIMLFDTYAVAGALLESSKATWKYSTPCLQLDRTTLITPFLRILKTCKHPNQRPFYDFVHPSAIVHDMVGKQMFQFLKSVNLA